jgi:hypothetical protein
MPVQRGHGLARGVETVGKLPSDEFKDWILRCRKHQEGRAAFQQAQMMWKQIVGGSSGRKTCTV